MDRNRGQCYRNRGQSRGCFLVICWEAEQNGRQYSPFEFVARELNNLQNGMHQWHFAYTPEIVPYPENGKALPAKDYDVWEVYEEGIYRGFLAELAEWLKD